MLDNLSALGTCTKIFNSHKKLNTIRFFKLFKLVNCRNISAKPSAAGSKERRQNVKGSAETELNNIIYVSSIY